MSQSASIWLLIALAALAANLPFLNQRWLAVWPAPSGRKSLGLRLLELVFWYFVTGGIGKALEAHAGQIHPQDWEFYAILPLFMFLILYVTFCKVDFRKIAVVRWHIWTSAFQMLFVALFMGIILLLKLSGDALILSESVLVCAISPCAAAAAVVTLKLGGNLEQMTTYTFLSNLLCVLLIPICFPLIEPASGITFWSAFLLILNKVFLVLVVPMLLALLTKSLPTLRRFHQWLIHIPDLSFYLWGCSLMIVTGTTLKNIMNAQTSLGFLAVIGLSGLVL